MIADTQLPQLPISDAVPRERLSAREKAARVITHCIIAISLLGIAIAFAEARGGLTQIAFGICNGLSVLLCFGLAATATRKRIATRSWLLIAASLYLVSGFFGVLVSFKQDPAPGFLITIVEIARAFIFFFALPAFSPLSVGEIVRASIRWLYAASLFLTVEALIFAASRGVGAFTDQRLSGQTEDWIHANSIGMYAGLVILCALLGKFPRWVQVFSVAIGGYILMLSQSRGSIASAAIALMIYVLLNWRYIRFKWVPVLLLPALAFFFSSPEAETLMADLPVVGPINKMIQRSQKSDPTSGRAELIGQALERVEESPVVGYGFRGGTHDTKERTTYIENMFMNALLEGGFIGGSLYVLVMLSTWFVFFRRTRRSAKYHPGRESGFDPLIAEACFVFVSFMIVQGLTERTSIIQNGSPFANMVAIFIGCVCYEPKARQIIARRSRTAAASV